MTHRRPSLRRPPARRAHSRAPSPPHAPRRQPEPQPTGTAALLANLPAPDQIAAKIRHQKIGAVLADICRDFGIPPSRPLWDELYRAINEFGGDPCRLCFDWLEQAFPVRLILARVKAKPEAPPEPVSIGPRLAAWVVSNLVRSGKYTAATGSRACLPRGARALPSTNG